MSALPGPDVQTHTMRQHLSATGPTMGNMGNHHVSAPRPLCDLASRLDNSCTPGAVAKTVVDYSHSELGALAASIAVVSPDGPEVRVLAMRGFCHVPDHLRTSATADPLPLADAIRTGESLWIDSPEGLGAWYSDRGRPESGDAIGAVAVIPLRGATRVMGVLALSFPAADPQKADPTVVRQVAHECSIALARAMALDAQRTELAELRAANERHGRVLSVLSHELRTPLNAILGFTTLIAEEICGPVTDAQRHHLARVTASARHLLLLVDDLLALRRLDAGGMTVHRDRVSIGAIMREAASMIEFQAHAKGLDLRVIVPEGSDETVTDATKVRQILVNLLSNAIKFTDHGWVELSGVVGGAGVTIEVRDTGVGIAPHDLKRVFDPFWQVADRDETQRRGGIGLGLDVSARVARVLGGELAADSTVGKGSTFTLVLPSVSA